MTLRTGRLAQPLLSPVQPGRTALPSWVSHLLFVCLSLRKSKRASPEIQSKVPQSSSTSTAVTSVPASPCKYPNREPSGGASCGFQGRRLSAYAGRPLTSVKSQARPQGPTSMPAPQGEGLLLTSHSTPCSSDASVASWAAEHANMSVWSLKDMLSQSSRTLPESSEGTACPLSTVCQPLVNPLTPLCQRAQLDGGSGRCVKVFLKGDTPHAHHSL